MKHLKVMVLVLTIAAVLLWTVNIDVLAVRLGEDMIYAIRMNEEKSFSIRWTHSVEKEEWEEFFQFEGENINLDSTRFKTFGAGVPNNAGTNSFIRDGWVYMVNINRYVGDELTVRSGKTTGHRLIYQRQMFPLPYQQNSYVICRERIPFASYLFHTISKNM
ncbi:uncharacterized protein DUF1850 [Melghiribacillus thermohalophilus]|uniref:Uncharacterized protein DUF1850 n=1 Tax=Melghiribacillus thermohalophilus TaxID=1324956 RepID=A0A4R3MTS7_9BACI|nr:DUF1850 domain-containing protein [Melghiribacillus thermohalophilus]TCT18276.1 uncharacterized protein DUF1850 [Melghiribacillus thermohalophilus]